jgi:hypothetical protein
MTAITTTAVRRSIQLMDNNNNNNDTKNESHAEYNRILLVYTRLNYILVLLQWHIVCHCVSLHVYTLHNTIIRIYPH